jgi:hypothetical protein
MYIRRVARFSVPFIARFYDPLDTQAGGGKGEGKNG